MTNAGNNCGAAIAAGRSRTCRTIDAGPARGEQQGAEMDVSMTLTEPIGYVASSLVFAAFCAKRMVPLRALAIFSNLAFIGYGYLDHLWPILILHAAMLPMNLIRFREAALAAGGANNPTGETKAPCAIAALSAEASVVPSEPHTAGAD